MSKDGIITEVRGIDKGSSPNSLSSTLASPLPEYLGPNSETMVFHNWPQGPLQSHHANEQRTEDQSSMIILLHAATQGPMNP